MTRATQEVKLRWFQYRLIHRILTTNTYLYKLKYTENDLCTFCQIESESIIHLLWECKFAQIFWKDFASWIKNCLHVCNMNLSLELILFGVKENFVTYNFFYLILLFAKFYIYKCKYQKYKPQFKIFCKELVARYNIEKT